MAQVEGDDKPLAKRNGRFGDAHQRRGKRSGCGILTTAAGWEDAHFVVFYVEGDGADRRGLGDGAGEEPPAKRNRDELSSRGSAACRFA